nr:sigma-70 family RNA polymerase sigma factor [Novosphingobium flavum]
MPHEAALRAWLLRRVSCRSDAEDIIQECYCTLSERGDFGSIQSPRAYLFTVARNLLLQEIRRNRIVQIDSVAELDRFDVVCEEPSPERVAAGRNELALVRQLIADLPARARKIVELRKIEGLSQKEIAVRLGVSVNVVENEASRGLKVILDRLTGGALASKARKQNDDSARNPRAN